MRVKKIALFMVPVLVLLCCSFAVAGNVVEYTYDADGNIQDAIFPSPTVQIAADPATIYEGQSATLTWTSTSATVCEIQPEVGGGLPPNGSATVSPTETTTYTITATSGGGTATDTVTVTVEPPPPPPTVTISADPATIDYGASTTLTWSSTDATACSIDQGVGTVVPPEGGSIDVSPTETTTYTITATGPVGETATDTVIVTVIPPPPPTVTISADPASIDYGASATLTWSSTNAESCTINQGIGAVDLNGSTTVSLTATTTYTITATGIGGIAEPATDSVTITVAPPPAPTVMISADPESIDYGATSTLSWTSTNADTVTIEPGIGVVEASGTREVSPTLTKTYTITATGIGGIAEPATDSVTITVAPPPAPTVTISPDPESIPNGESATLTWSSNYATSCEIQPGVGTVDLNGSVSVSPNETTVYTITATGIGGGTATDTATVTVVGCDIYLHDETIAAGSTVVRTTACTITAGPNYIIEAGATVTFQAAQGITLAPGFEAREGCEFTANCNITPPAPLVSISADPDGIAYGETSTLSWTSTNADTVTIDQGIGAVDPSGSTPVSPAETTTYTITATGPGGTATDSVTVAVLYPATSTYYVLTPELAGAAIGVVSLADGNIITAGATVLNLDKFQSGEIPANAVSPGGVIVGNAPFTVGSAQNGTDMPVPASFAGTTFVIPHVRSDHEYTYYILSPAGDAQVQITIGADTSTITTPEGQVVTVDAGSDNTISGVVTSDLPILVSHVARTTTGGADDVYPVPPASMDLVGVRSQNAIIGALEDNTSVTAYASDGSSTTMTLNAGARKSISIGDNSSQGMGSALHVLANKSVAGIQYADGDGTEMTAFLGVPIMGTDYGIPVDTQYVAVVCLDANTTVTLYDSAGTQLDQQTCSGDGTTPGKAYFGSETNGTHIPAGSRIESTRPVYLIYEAGASNDEHNLLGVILDTDGDGMPDGWELFYGLDPLIDDANGDLDGDGITNLEEYNQNTNPTPPPTVTISADPASIDYGATSTLSWTSTNAHTVSIDQGIGEVELIDTLAISPTATTTYTITATGPGGTATNSTTVTVTSAPPAPTVSISADPASIDYGGTSTLSWTSTNADTVTIDQGIGAVGLNGSTTISPTETTTYTVTATGPGGTATDSVTVTVLEGDIYLHDETIAAGSTVEHTTQYSIFAGPNYIIEAGATVTLQAGQEITLNPGFEAREGCELRAFLTP